MKIGGTPVELCDVLIALSEFQETEVATGPVRQDIVGKQVSYSLSLWERVRVRAHSVEKKEERCGGVRGAR